MHYDLRTISYEGFLDFIFDHPATPSISKGSGGAYGDPGGRWFDEIDLEIDFDPALNCEYLTLLFCDPRELLVRYSRAQIEQGLWWMQTSYNDGSAADVLWTASLPVERRLAMIRAMYFLYSELFSGHRFGRAPHMWWENLARPVAGLAGGEAWWADRHRIENAMFRTLSSLLDLDAEQCRIDALHGLNHLAHPDRELIIGNYLDRRSELDETHRTYARKAMAGALA